MEETLNTILLELQQINKGHHELLEVQNGLIHRIENIEKIEKKLVTSTNNINKNLGESVRGQQELKVLIGNLENIKDFLSLGKNEIKELIKQTTVYIAGKMSFSERILLEIDLLNEQDRSKVLNKINENNFMRKKHTWDENNWDEDY